MSFLNAREFVSCFLPSGLDRDVGSDCIALDHWVSFNFTVDKFLLRR